MYDFDEINDVLNDLAIEGVIEPLAEPIDCDDCHPLDWAEVVGCFDDVVSILYPEA